MLIGLDANEANVARRVGSNQFAFHVLWQLYKQDKKNSYLVYLQSQPLNDLPPARTNWQYKILKPRFFWTRWRLPLSLYFDQPRPQIFFTLGHYAPRFSPVPTLIAIMDLAFLRFPQTFLKKDLLKLTAWTKASAQKARHIFTISQASKQDIQKYYGIPANKITVAYPGVKFPRPSSKPPYQNYLLYLGTLQPRKNLANLIKAFALIKTNKNKSKVNKDKSKNLKLVIAGKKGWLFKPLFHLVKQLQLQPQVIFTGFVSDTRAASLIKHAQALILPSLYEGFGIPVVQAMALNTPVIVSRNSSLKEIVKNYGIYIQSPFGPQEIKQSIIKTLALTPTKKNQLIQPASQVARKFTWKNTGQTILEVLNDITL